MDIDAGRALRGESDDRSLIRLFQTGDTLAGDELFRRHKGYLIETCDEYGKLYPWLGWDDRWSAALEGFTRALKDFDLSWNNGLNAYLRHKVPFALLDVLKDRLKNGIGGTDTRAGRWLSGDWENRNHLPLEEIALQSKVSVQAAFAALEEQRALREGQIFYDTVGEGGYDFPTDPIGPDIGLADIAQAMDEAAGVAAADADLPPVLDASGLGADSALDAEAGDADATDGEDDQGSKDALVEDESLAGEDHLPLNNDEWANYSKRRANAKAQDNPGPYAKSVPAPLKQVDRAQYETDQWMAFRHQPSSVFAQAVAGTVWTAKQKLPAGSAATRAAYEKAVETRLDRYELDCETYERDRAAGKAFWTIPERVERPLTGEPTWEGLDKLKPAGSRIRWRGVSTALTAVRLFEKQDRRAAALAAVESERRRKASLRTEADYNYRFKRLDERQRVNISNMPEDKRRQLESLKDIERVRKEIRVELGKSRAWLRNKWSEEMKEQKDKTVMVIRCRRQFAEAVTAAANSQMLTKSDYVRQATLEALRADGVKLASAAA